jgi:hypothetical protein
MATTTQSMYRAQHLMRPGPYPPKYIYIYIFCKKVLLAQGVQFFVAVPMMPRGTLGGAYHRTYLHMHARYRDWVGGVQALFVVLNYYLSF